ncbi:MAG: LysE family translocator [Gammaproteobacteria bacterium]
MTQNLAQFAVVALALVVSPGPDTMVILRHAICGRGNGLRAVWGVQTGLLVHLALIVSGLSLLIAAEPRLLRAVAFVGSIYLAWLAFGIIRAPFSINGGGKSGGFMASPFRHGMLTNLLNPKVILIFAGLMPNFTDAKLGATSLQFVLLAAILIIINTLYQSALCFFADAVRGFLITDGKRQKMARFVLGAALLAFAVLLFAGNVRG